jgi:hypothetical protein
MKQQETESPLARRSFMGRLWAGVAAFSATAVVVPGAEAQSMGNGEWQPARHAADDWLDQVPGRHRFVFDTTKPEGFDWGLRFANNYLNANKEGYGLEDSDAAVVIVARHLSTAYAFNDAIWSRYGTLLAERMDLEVKTPTSNPHNRERNGATLPNLIGRGAHFAVCGFASRAIAGSLARSTGGDADAINKEIAENLIESAHMMTAGILAVNRAQERGYSFVSS